MEKDSFNVGAIVKLLKRLIAIWFCVLMFSSVAGVSTVKKWAIIGQAAKLFNMDNDYAEPSLYNKTQLLIASWKGTTYTEEGIDPHYSGKIFMDKKRNIWIFDVEKKDAGKYYLKFGLQIVQLEIELVVKEELTEEQPQECLNNHPDFTKEGNLTGEQIGQIKKLLDDNTKHIKEHLGNLTGEQIGQIRKLLDDNTKHIKEHLGNLTGEQIGQIRKLLDDNTKHIKEHLDSWIPPIIDLLKFITEMIIVLYLLLANRNQIREGLINMKGWIEKKLCCQHKFEDVSRTQDIVIAMEGVPQPVQVTSHRDSPDSISYQLMWDKPDDGGSPLIKYIIRYCEVEINPNGTEYEMSKPLSPLDISPSDESFTLSSLKPGSYYQVEVQAVNSIGMSSRSFIFKTKESAPKQAVEEEKDKMEPPRGDEIFRNDNLELPVHQASGHSFPIMEDNLELLVHQASGHSFPIMEDTQSSTSNVEQNTNIKSKKGPEEKLESLDSDSDSNDEQDKLLKDPVDQNL